MLLKHLGQGDDERVAGCFITSPWSNAWRPRFSVVVNEAHDRGPHVRPIVLRDEVGGIGERGLTDESVGAGSPEARHME